MMIHYVIQLKPIIDNNPPPTQLEWNLPNAKDDEDIPTSVLDNDLFGALTNEGDTISSSIMGQ